MIMPNTTGYRRQESRTRRLHRRCGSRVRDPASKTQWLLGIFHLHRSPLCNWQVYSPFYRTFLTMIESTRSMTTTKHYTIAYRSIFLHQHRAFQACRTERRMACQTTKSTTAPTTATKRLQTLKPVTPVAPAALKIHPPITAPTIPSKMSNGSPSPRLFTSMLAM